jgi:hypothetical protein
LEFYALTLGMVLITTQLQVNQCRWQFESVKTWKRRVHAGLVKTKKGGFISKNSVTTELDTEDMHIRAQFLLPLLACFPYFEKIKVSL